MKKTFLIIIIFVLCVTTLHAQILYNLSTWGGKYGYGTIGKFLPATNELTVVRSFGEDNLEGLYLAGTLAKASNGKLYGMTKAGGTGGFGGIFSFDPSTSTHTKLKDFDYINGAYPLGSLVQANDGKLYGMITQGGINGGGVIYSFDPSSLTYTKLKDFNELDGNRPIGSLIQASDGKLYGMTVAGGSGGYGVIFSFNPSDSVYSVIKSFDLTNGGVPYGNLVQASDGKLYGMTREGGTSDAGVIFSFDIATSRYTKLISFDGSNGANPEGTMIQASDGKLYGMTSGGDNSDGNIFSFDIISYTLKNLWNFDGINGGAPIANLMQASDGKLYGMARFGPYGEGIIFSFDLTTSRYAKLIDYTGTNGGDAGLGSGFVEVSECKPADSTWYRDADGDSYGNPASSVKACTQPAGYVTDNTDCNDNNKAIHSPVTYYRDFDGDCFGDPYHPSSFCSDVPPVGYVKNNYDCYDGEGASEPGNVRIRMCHDGWTQCVYAKDIAEKLCLGWTVGLCPLESCAADETLMCHNGKQECVKTTDVAAKLADTAGKWSLGPYCSGVPISGSGLNRQGKIALAGIEKSISSLPTQYSLSNHPNPFAGTSTIKYELPYDSKVSIKVYDLAGRTVATVVDEYKKAGTYTVNFNAAHLSSGSLFYKITATSKEGQFERTNQMVKIK